MAEGEVCPSEGEFSYFCILCSERYTACKRRFTAIASLESCFTCVKCGQTFKTGFKSKNDILTDMQYPRCETCGMIFGSSTQLLYHSYEHSGEWPYRCTLCEKGFAVYSKLEQHMKQRETIRFFDCNNCFESFRGKVCYNVTRQSDFEPCCEKCSNGSSTIEYVTP